MALRADLDIALHWNGKNLDRTLNAGHSAMHKLVVGILIAAGWEVVPERSFSIWGKRGVIDILALDAATRTLLVVELKTEIADVQQLVGTVDRYRRLAPQVGRELGWDARSVGVWVAVTESPRTAAGWASMPGSCALRSRPTAARSAAGCAARPARSGYSRSYQMPVWRTERQLGRRGAACEWPRERPKDPPGCAKPIM